VDQLPQVRDITAAKRHDNADRKRFLKKYHFFMAALANQ